VRLLVGCGQWSLIGGSERYARELVQELARRGHALVVLYGDGDPNPSSNPSPESVDGVLFERFEALAPLTAPSTTRAKLRGRLAAHAPELVLQLTPCAAWIVSEYQAAAPYARFVQDHTLFCPGLNKLHADGEPCRSPLGRACLERYFLGSGCHGFRPASGRRPVWKAIRRLRVKRREFALHERAQLLLVASEYMRGELMAAGAPPERVVVLPYATRAGTGATPPLPLPEDTQAFLAQDAGADPNPVLVTPARLALPDKGVDVLLEILQSLQQPFRAVIAGSGPAREELERSTRERGLSSHVHFAGWLDAGQMETLYEAADAVLFPSTWDEPFGLVGIEAMAHGVPVVAFDVGGVGQWLEDGVGGWRLPRGDVAAFARAVDRLLDEPEVAQRAGASGRVRVERDFRYGVHGSRLEALLEGLIAGGRAEESVQGRRSASV